MKKIRLIQHIAFLIMLSVLSACGGGGAPANDAPASWDSTNWDQAKWQ